MKTETVHIVLGREQVLTADLGTLLEPIWWTANFYEDGETFDRSVAGFSMPQRHAYAIAWYRAEVGNGGHDQFFSNSTGLIWQDALRGLRVIGATKFVAILETALARFAELPSRDHGTRLQQLDVLAQGFDDEDERFYVANAHDELEAVLMAYVRQNADAFRFDGTIERPIIGRRNA